jgi:lactoylglutathione lyase
VKLNHMNLAVDDVPATRQFLERNFDLRPVGEGHKNFVILLDDDGFALTLMGVGRFKTAAYPKTFHIGFIQPTDADVNAVHQRLTDEGLSVDSPSHRHGAWSFSCEAPGGLTIVIRSAIDWQAEETAIAGHDGSHRHRHRH